MKFNIKILVSVFCILSSCAFTYLFMFLNENNNMKSETIVSSNKKDFSLVSKKNNNNTTEETKVIIKGNKIKDTNSNKEEKEEEKEEIIVEPERKIVYDNMTIEELASKLDKSLSNELAGKGYLYASYSIEKGVDPYLAVAISLEETGCNSSSCSYLVRACNNVGGMKGSGCGAYGYFNSIDDGIRAFIDNIYRNYVAYGLTNAELMNPKYAENPAWSYNVNNYINIIKNK